MSTQRMRTFMDTYSTIKTALSSTVLKRLIGNADPALDIYGSIVNSLATNHDSDLDLTLLLQDFSLNHEFVLKVIGSEL